MKKVSGLLILLFCSVVLFAQEGSSGSVENSVPGPAITFEEIIHDFGDINQGDKVEFVFNFENTGDAPLIITNVKVTCGCTATDWPRDQVMPGDQSSITVQFNSAGKKGRQNKVITVVSNASSPLNQVTIAANVLVKDKDSTGVPSSGMRFWR